MVLIIYNHFQISDSVFIQYDAPEKIVRFALTSSVGPSTGNNFNTFITLYGTFIFKIK